MTFIIKSHKESDVTQEARIKAMECGFSDNEMKLIKFFGCEMLAGHANVSPLTVYDLMAVNAFRKNLCGEEVNALRRAIDALHKMEPLRGTPEFDKLISF